MWCAYVCVRARLSLSLFLSVSRIRFLRMHLLHTLAVAIEFHYGIRVKGIEENTDSQAFARALSLSLACSLACSLAHALRERACVSARALSFKHVH